MRKCFFFPFLFFFCQVNKGIIIIIHWIIIMYDCSLDKTGEAHRTPHRCLKEYEIVPKCAF